MYEGMCVCVCVCVCGQHYFLIVYSGFGTASDTNQRFHYLLNQGQTGLSVAFDLPTLMGLDSDHITSNGEIGKCGVAIDTLADMEILFKNIDLEKISNSMTINCPAAIIWAMSLVSAEKHGFQCCHVNSKLFLGINFRNLRLFLNYFSGLFLYS